MFEHPGLESTQKETDTRRMLHAIHATEQLIHNIVIHTPDTDVVVIALSVSEIYIKLFLYQNWFKKQKENPKPQ